ncbi:hypothetical protein TNCV_3271611 [Trichonephila clavipes]|nr:hypothetical protein TNCV_3271611 [Trichonephila clavipes]
MFQYGSNFKKHFGRISAITCRMYGQAFVAYPHRPMTLHSKNKVFPKILRPISKQKIRRSPNVSIKLWHELCDMLRRLVGTTAPGHHDC